MSTIATAYVQILPSTKGIKSALSSELNGAGTEAGKNMGSNITSGLTSSIKGASMVAVGVALGTALVRGISSAVKEGGNLEQSIGGIQTLFKNSADTVMKDASEAWKTAGISANEYMEQTTSFGASLIKSLGGDTAKAAQMANTAIIDMSDNANKMGTDIGMIQNAYQGFAKGNFTMLDNLKLGYGGTKQEMQKLLDEASKLSGIRYNIDNFGDIVAAIHEIQKELDITGTTAKEASETLTGSFNAVKSAAKNVLGNLALGGDMSGTLKEFASSFETFFNDNLLPMIDNIVSNLPDFFSAIFVNMTSGDGLSNAIKQITVIVGKLVKAFIQSLGEFTAAAPLILMKIIEGLSEAAPEIAKAIPDLIMALVDGFQKYGPEIIKEMPKLVIAMAKGLAMAAVYLLEGLAELMYEFIAGIPEYASEVAGAFQEMGGSVAGAISSWGSSIAAAVSPAVEFLKNAFGPAITGIASHLGPLVSSFKNMFTQIGGFAQACVNLVVTAFSPIAQKISTMFQNGVNAIKSAFSPIGTFMAEVANKIIASLQSAAGKFKQIGADMMNKLKEGILSVIDNIIKFIQDKVNAIANLFSNLTDFVNKAADGITKKTTSMSTTVSKTTSTAKSSVSRVGSSSLSSYNAYNMNNDTSTQPVNVNVTLSGSAKNIFDSVQVENTKMVTATGYHALA